MTSLKLSAISAVLLTVQVHSQSSTTTYDIDTSQAWGFGFLTGVGLSLLGFVAAVLIVALRNVISQKTFKIIINLLYALGCGAMVGDAMIHILPDSYSSPDVNFRFVALIFISAIGVFIGVQRLFVICGISHQHWGDEDHDHSHTDQHGHKNKHENDGHQHSHKHKRGQNQCEGEIKVDIQKVGQNNEGDSPKKQQESFTNFQIKILKQEDPVESYHDLQKNLSNKVEKKDDEDSKKVEKQNTKEQQKQGQQNCLQRFKNKGSAGYLNILSSFIHNFFDGFAIGAAFASRQKSQYIPTLIAIYAHQIPRQMGDVGILIKNKFNSMQTIFCNVIVNFTSLIGVVVGLALGSISSSVQTYILSFVAGNFIYIGADIWRNLLKNREFCPNFLEFLSFSIGIGSMYLVLLAQG